MSRPKSKDPKVAVIRIRVTPEEAAILKANAAASGVSLSEYTRAGWILIGQVME